MSFHKNVRVNLRLKKIAFAKRPVPEKSKFQIHREVKVKRSCYGVGVALLCELGFDSHWYEQLSNCPTLFYWYIFSLRGE